MVGAEHYGLIENYDRKNKGCSDWEFDVSYGQTFGKEAEIQYMSDIKKDGKTCGHCLYSDIGFCVFADCYPQEITNRGVISK